MSLYSLDPLKFQEADAQLAEVERQRERPLLHGDGERKIMATKEQAMEKIKEMIPDFQEWLLKRCDELLTSGGIDLTGFANDYRLPKIVLTAALADAGETLYSPRDPISRRIAQNLRHF